MSISKYTTPGVFIKNITPQPSPITSVEIAIPAFIGYTEKATRAAAGDLTLRPTRITNLQEYEHYFGYPQPENKSLSIVFNQTTVGTDVVAQINEQRRSKYLMHYSLQFYFANGGGACWITSVGDYSQNVIAPEKLNEGLKKVARKKEVTLLLFPDAVNIASAADYYHMYSRAIAQATRLRNRFVIMDVFHDAAHGSEWKLDIDDPGGNGGLRNLLSGGPQQLGFAAAYFPKIFTSIPFSYQTPGSSDDNERLIRIRGASATTLAALKKKNNAEYLQATNALSKIPMLLPASPGVAGMYAKVDKSKGVWKAPANVNLEKAIRTEHQITDVQQENLNVDVIGGKSINVIRSFAGRGDAIVWGSRTLAGNDNEWRYVPVRRYCLMLEQSIRISLKQFRREANDQNLWQQVRGLIENYLTEQWKAGALQGIKPEHAFYVRAGLGTTMTPTDIQNGNLIAEIGVAVIRPAEFVIPRFFEKMIAG